MAKFCERAARNGTPIYLYGGRGPAERELLERRLSERFPGLRIAGGSSPPFRALTPAEDEHEIELINSSGAAVVWVGTGQPRQEQWMHEMRSRLTRRCSSASAPRSTSTRASCRRRRRGCSATGWSGSIACRASRAACGDATPATTRCSSRASRDSTCAIADADRSPAAGAHEPCADHRRRRHARRRRRQAPARRPRLRRAHRRRARRAAVDARGVRDPQRRPARAGAGAGGGQGLLAGDPSRELSRRARRRCSAGAHADRVRKRAAQRRDPRGAGRWGGALRVRLLAAGVRARRAVPDAGGLPAAMPGRALAGRLQQADRRALLPRGARRARLPFTICRPFATYGPVAGGGERAGVRAGGARTDRRSARGQAAAGGRRRRASRR